MTTSYISEFNTGPYNVIIIITVTCVMYPPQCQNVQDDHDDDSGVRGDII